MDFDALVIRIRKTEQAMAALAYRLTALEVALAPEPEVASVDLEPAPADDPVEPAHVANPAPEPASAS